MKLGNTERGLLITVEGADGAGKSTQMAFIAEWLRQHGIELVETREPGGTGVGEELRTILLQGKSLNISDDTELMMIFAARQQHIDEVIDPAIGQGKWVLSDRFTDATYAYQGFGRGIPLSRIAQLERWVQHGLQPALTLILDIDVEAGIERSRTRGEQPDRFEQQALEFKQAVRAGYLARAKQFPERIRVVDSSVSVESVRQQLDQVLTHFMQTLPVNH